MKRFILVALLVSAFCDARSQTDVENKLKLDMWTNASKEFKTTEVPEKWKNESAVVLALDRE